MALSDRQRFEDFLGKFAGCYRSVEVRAVCGKWDGQLRSIWTRLEFRPEPQSALRFSGELPDTDSVKAIHAVFPSGDGRMLMDSIEAGLLKCGEDRITYLGGYSQKLQPGVPLSQYYCVERTITPDVPSGWPQWTYCRLVGDGVQSTDCVGADSEDVRRQLRSLDHPYQDLADLVRRFGGYANRFSPVPGRSQVVICAPLMLRLGGCSFGEDGVTVSVEGAPAFAEMPARIAVFGVMSRGSEPFSEDLPREEWRERGDLTMLTKAYPVVCGDDAVLALSVEGYCADEFRRKSRLAQDGEPRGLPHQGQSLGTSRKVFVAHGRDEGAREAIARFLERLDFEPIVLQEQPSKGQTVTEKFEEYSDVAFAVVLLTPDDVGHPTDRPEEARSRARQNAIFEMGYFSARLERRRVCALLKGDIERPSDIAGIIYVKLDEKGAWKIELAKELNAAGLEADLNKIL